MRARVAGWLNSGGFVAAVHKLALTLMLAAAPAAAYSQTPTVNGLFYGDGDDALYSEFMTSLGGSVLYSYLDAPNATLYVALVVDHSVNDVVCSADRPYTSSAGWGPPRACDRLTDSEFAEFTLECAPGSANSWTWQQGFATAATTSLPPSDWHSDENSGASGGDWPPGIKSSSSFVANVNTYQSNASGTRAWDLYDGGTQVSGWKSPFVSSAPNDVTQVPGYPTFSTTDPNSGLAFDWEWSMVYEWSVNLGPDGANCGPEPVYFVTGSSHHSPAKDGQENDCFFGEPIQDPNNPNEEVCPEPEDPPEEMTLTDWGDVPDDFYGTTRDSDGARHEYRVTGPFLGQDLQMEIDGQPTQDASGDGAEEDGVTINVTGNWTPGSEQTIEVEVSNAPNGALLGGWFDWNGDDLFDGDGEFFSWPVVDGVNQLQISVGDSFDWQSHDLYARFRIFSGDGATPSGSLSQSDSVGKASDGEVEDYFYAADTLPVSLNAFSSGLAGDGLVVEWQTSSETNNVGFEVWGQTAAGEWRVLTDFIPSKGMNSALPQEYEESIAADSEIIALALVDYDTRGRPERFGPFTTGEQYGEVEAVEEIDWEAPRVERKHRLELRGFVNTSPKRTRDSGKRRSESAKRHAERAAHRPAIQAAGNVVADFARGERFRKLVQNGGSQDMEGKSNRTPRNVNVAGPQGDNGANDRETIMLKTGAVTHLAVTEPGIQRVTYEALRDAGLDLAGVRHNDIAVTSRGEPVARWIEGSGNVFGPGHWIEFIGRPPEGDDALYVEANLYQISNDPLRARQTKKLGEGRTRKVSTSYRREAVVDRPLMHHPQSQTGDPWIERTVLVWGGSAAVSLDLPVEGPVLDDPATLKIDLGTLTDLPPIAGADGEAIPEHNVSVQLKGPDASSDFVEVTKASTSGRRHWEIEAIIPDGLVTQAGTYTLRLVFDTEYMFSLVLVDRYAIQFASPYHGPRLDFAPDPKADGYRIENLGGATVSAYAEGSDGGLTRIDPRLDRSGDEYAAELRQVDATRFWVDASPLTPDVFTTQASGDLLAEPAGLVIIAESSFVGTEPLEEYVRSKAAYNPVVVDVEDIYNSVGYGMALPGAINDYLKARNEVHPFTHVQLVGADCYDRHNYISDCISFIPLPTAPVGVTVYSPSQNRLVDLDGDGVGDKPIGQFSVREESELETVVAKGSSWLHNVSGSRSALLIADDSDGINDFAGQIHRLKTRLDWPDTDVIEMTDYPAIDAARDALKTSLDTGRALTVFSGHSGARNWSNRRILTPAIAQDLGNQGRPTMMVPLACETTYDISHNANVLGHQLMYAGDRGAVAISGAVSLSGLEDNERMAGHIIDGMKAGLTLGEAVQSGRETLGTDYRTLHDNWITQGDVTTRLAQ